MLQEGDEPANGVAASRSSAVLTVLFVTLIAVGALALSLAVPRWAAPSDPPHAARPEPIDALRGRDEGAEILLAADGGEHDGWRLAARPEPLEISLHTSDGSGSGMQRITEYAVPYTLSEAHGFCAGSGKTAVTLFAGPVQDVVEEVTVRAGGMERKVGVRQIRAAGIFVARFPADVALERIEAFNADGERVAEFIHDGPPEC